MAPGTEYTSLWLSKSTAQSVRADRRNLQGSTNVVLPLKLPPNGGDLWVELQPSDVVDGPVEARVDRRGKRWLGTTLKLQRGKPLLLDPKRRHATSSWTGERVVLVAYTVNTLGKVPESEFKTLEALNFPLPVSVRLPLTELDVFDCFEEEPLAEVEARRPNGQTSELVGGSTAKGGGWKETQRVEAGTVDLEHERNYGLGMGALVTVLLEHARNFSLGMGALVTVCSWNTNGIEVWAWVLWSPYALGTRTELCSGHHVLLEHERNYRLGMDALVSVCSWNTNGIEVWAWILWSPYALGTRTQILFGHGCSGHRMLLEHERNYGLSMGALVTVCSWNTN